MVKSVVLISVIIPTYNPKIATLNQTLAGLKNQIFPIMNWELIIIDNNSDISFSNHIDLTWHSNSRIVKERKAGLTFARLNGFEESKGNLIIMVDDDNILSPDYLTNAYNIFKNNSELGAIGGKSLPLFDFEPPYWLKNFYGNLALRDLGEEIIIEKWQNCYPVSAPIGAGMVIKKLALDNYIKKVINNTSIIKDRTRKSLSSGGDNDIILEILKAGWKVGYFPKLELKHIIPENRIKLQYMARLVHDTNKSWVQVLENHQINPWKRIHNKTLLLRKIKSFFVHSAWKGKVNYLRWKSACGLYEGLASI